MIAFMTISHHDYEIDDDFARIDFPRVQPWLALTYWSPGVSLERVRKAAAGSSLVIGAYLAQTQVAYLRVVSDKTTFAGVCDVIVNEAHRGRGLARAMGNFALAHPEHQGLRRWVLATKDAQGVYENVGFEPLPMPDRWLVHLPSGKLPV